MLPEFLVSKSNKYIYQTKQHILYRANFTLEQMNDISPKEASIDNASSFYEKNIFIADESNENYMVLQDRSHGHTYILSLQPGKHVLFFVEGSTITVADNIDKLPYQEITTMLEELPITKA